MRTSQNKRFIWQNNDSAQTIQILVHMLSLQSQLPDYSAALDRLKKLKLHVSRRSLKYLEVISYVTFFLTLPSWLL